MRIDNDVISQSVHTCNLSIYFIYVYYKYTARQQLKEETKYNKQLQTKTKTESTNYIKIFNCKLYQHNKSQITVERASLKL